jgi:hypothetical protein
MTCCVSGGIPVGDLEWLLTDELDLCRIEYFVETLRSGGALRVARGTTQIDDVATVWQCFHEPVRHQLRVGTEIRRDVGVEIGAGLAAWIDAVRHGDRSRLIGGAYRRQHGGTGVRKDDHRLDTWQPDRSGRNRFLHVALTIGVDVLVTLGRLAGLSLRLLLVIGAVVAAKPSDTERVICLGPHHAGAAPGFVAAAALAAVGAGAAVVGAGALAAVGGAGAVVGAAGLAGAVVGAAAGAVVGAAAPPLDGAAVPQADTTNALAAATANQRPRGRLRAILLS